MTARDLVRIALIKIGVLSDAESPTAVQLIDGLRDLNALVSSLSLESAFIFTVTREAFPHIGGKASYTMGPGGDFDTNRPVRFTEASFRDASGTDWPVRILTDEEWARIPQKNLEGSVITRIYTEGTFPEEKLNVWPQPVSGGGMIVLGTKKPMEKFEDGNAEIILPPGYELFLIHELGIVMAPGYSVSISAEHASVAQGARERVLGVNQKEQLLGTEATGFGRCHRYGTGGGDC